ncbi:MAG: putative histidine kinase, hybrid [Ramlibacter sp.]|jgi:signal transduction histidine kinase/ActR/RegA family two-component response regulator|nr:putative histidine kinase, hybrid [Ramlibacter sp.]
MVPAALAAVGTIYYVYSEKLRQFESGLGEATRALSLVVDREIARRAALVRTLSSSPSLRLESLETFYQYAKNIAPDASTVVVLADLDGRQLLNTRRPFGDTSLPRVVYTFEQVRNASGGVLVSDLYYAPLGKQHSFAVTVLVEQDGRPRYMLSYAGYASALQKVFEDQKLPQSWIASVVDSKGVVVARNTEAARFIGRPSSERLRSQIGKGRSGLYETRTLNGVETLSSFSTAPDYGWTAVIGVPLTQVGSPERAAAGFAALSAALLAIALWAAIRLERGIARPVLQAKDAAERIGRAESVEVHPTGLAEVDKVLQVLAESSRAVERSNQEMQARVRDALAEAEKAHQAVLQNQRLEALGQLTGGVAHDFNNLLMVVGNYAHLLRARRPELADTAEVAGIERAVDTGARLTRQLLAFARRQPVRPEPVDLHVRLPEIAGLLKASVGSRIQLTCEVAPGTHAIQVDPAEFELALLNLAVNARDAMPEGGTLRVAAGNDDGGRMVRIEVSDSGRGIPRELLEKVFEPFFTTKPVGHGTGLGLSQVYGLARQAGGDARIDSVEGQGTTVALLLPALVDVPVPRAQDPQQPPQAAAGRNRLLLVEDNEELAGVTSRVLESAGYAVTLAVHGDAARSVLDGGATFDIVLSDIRMPGGTDGIALARWLREQHPQLPVVLMTGYTAELTQARALGLQVLPKPSAPAVILKALSGELLAPAAEQA